MVPFSLFFFWRAFFENRSSTLATEADLARAVDSVNERLTRLDMRLQFGLNDITGENFVALVLRASCTLFDSVLFPPQVNLSGDKAAQLATDFTAHEITFIQKAVYALISLVFLKFPRTDRAHRQVPRGQDQVPVPV